MMVFGCLEIWKPCLSRVKNDSRPVMSLMVVLTSFLGDSGYQLQCGVSQGKLSTRLKAPTLLAVLSLCR